MSEMTKRAAATEGGGGVFLRTAQRVPLKASSGGFRLSRGVGYQIDSGVTIFNTICADGEFNKMPWVFVCWFTFPAFV